MKKTKLGPQTLLYPMPAFLIGANVNGKPNFMTAAWSGIANSNPPMVTVAIQHHRFTLKGIKENDTFSVNVPDVDLAKETDYCGIVSGVKDDAKAETCGFTVFYGPLTTAPMIAECPANLECRVVHILNLGSHALVIGRIEETFIDEDCVTEGVPDVSKVNPLCYVTGGVKAYHSMGPAVAPAFSAGMEIKKKA